MAQRLKDSPHYEQLKQSVDYAYRQRETVLGFTLTVILWLCVILGRQDKVVPTIIVWALCGPFILVSLIRWRRIFLHIDHYYFFETVLEQPGMMSRPRRAYFTVTVTDPQGRQFQSSTATIYSSIKEPTLEAYANQRVLAAYNKKTSQLVVIKKLDK